MNQRTWMKYRACVEELLFSSRVQHMRPVRYHLDVPCYKHSVFMSYMAWYLVDRWEADTRIAVRVGLLHDLYPYDPRTLPSYWQCFAHPAIAVENTVVLCDGLTAREKNCISTRMRPLSRQAPCSRETAVVCLADKLCVMAEIIQTWRNLGLRRVILSGARVNLSLIGLLLFFKRGRWRTVLQRKEQKKGREAV